MAAAPGVAQVRLGVLLVAGKKPAMLFEATVGVKAVAVSAREGVRRGG